MHQGAVTGDSVWPFNTAIACQQWTNKWPEARSRKPQLSPGVRSWQRLSNCNDSCGDVSEGRSLSESKALSLSNIALHEQYLRKTRLMVVHPLQQYTPGSYTVGISLFHSPSLAISSIIWALTGFLEGAKGEERNKIDELQSILSFFLVLCEWMYFSVWKPTGAAAWGSDIMSLPDCFRAWQKNRACSVLNALFVPQSIGEV